MPITDPRAGLFAAYFELAEDDPAEDISGFVATLREWLTQTGGNGRVERLGWHQCMIVSDDPTTVFNMKLRWSGTPNFVSIEEWDH